MEQVEKIQKIGVTEVQKLKTSAKRFYITVSRRVVETYALLPGDLLIVQIKEARRKPREAEA